MVQPQRVEFDCKENEVTLNCSKRGDIVFVDLGYNFKCKMILRSCVDSTEGFWTMYLVAGNLVPNPSQIPWVRVARNLPLVSRRMH